MLGTEVTRGDVGVTKEGFKPNSVISMIGMSGPVTGTVAISLPKETALAIIKALLGTEQEEIDETVTDGVAEIVNMIAGAAKAKLTADGGAVTQLSLPTVVYGENYQVNYPTQSVWLEVPFDTDLGPLTLRVTMKKE